MGFYLDRHAARPEDETLAGYERRLSGHVGERGFGMVVADAMALDLELWRRARRFLAALYPRVGMPPGGAHSEIFMGNYRRSFFGVHKDHLETFTFVIRGRKRFLAWPYEMFLDLPDVAPGRELRAFRLDDFDLEPWRDQAIVLEGGPGDVFYWPAGYWHVAEDETGEFVTTLTLSFGMTSARCPGSPFRLAEEGYSEAADDGHYPPEPTLPPTLSPESVSPAITAAFERLQSAIADPAITTSRREALLIWLSNGGFKRGPEKRPLPDLQPEDWILSDASCPILWDEPNEEGFPCAVNGIVLVTLPQFLPLCRLLNEGGRFQVGALMARFSEGEGAPEAEEIREALCHLASAHGVWEEATQP